MNQKPPNNIKQIISNFNFGGYKPKNTEFEDSDGLRTKKRNNNLKERIIEKIGNLVEFFLLRKVFITLPLFYLFIIFPFSKIDIMQIDWKLYFDHIDNGLKILLGYLVTIALISFL